MARKDFAELTKEELTHLWHGAVDGTIKAAKALHMSGLSGPNHDVYSALEGAIFDEWESAHKDEDLRDFPADEHTITEPEANAAEDTL